MAFFSLSHRASLRSLKDILYKKRMERQLAAARGLGPMGERPPDEDGGGVGPGGIPTAGSKVLALTADVHF